MVDQKRFRELSDLKNLLPENQKAESSQPTPTGHDGKGKVVHVSLDSKGRKGKKVTLIEGFQHNPATISEVAKILKQHCGAGGTVKGMTIEIQGDQRERVSEKLREIGYVIR